MTESPFLEEVRLLCGNLLPKFIGAAHAIMDTKVKIDGTPVTSLDEYAMESFRRVIEKRFPRQVTIGEEDKRDADQLQRLMSRDDESQWSIDGLDGTWHFEAGTNSYGAAIAQRYGENVEQAIIFRPIDMALRGNGFFYAARGEGAWEYCSCSQCGGVYHRLHTAAHNPRRFVAMLEGSSKDFAKPPLLNIGVNLTTRPSMSSCIAATTVARGSLEARAVVTTGHKPWDGWPIALFIQEAGGIVTDHQGDPYSASDCGKLIAAANSEDHTTILQLLKGGA
jgi:fructose-1,6-bisphosphatase/inositol monophosphatase family enzyme